MSDARTRLGEAQARLGSFVRATPALMKGFGELSRNATAPGSFTAAQKELIAVALAVVQGCEECVLYHVDAARRHGADEAALLEALGVAVEMGGGPAVMHAAKALEAHRALA